MKRAKDAAQLALFDLSPPPEELAPWDRELEHLAAALPEHLRLGTSSWTFEGWTHLVYRKSYPNQRAFTRESLAEYARHPLMRTVGIDRSHYKPLDEASLREYSAQLPEGFRCVSKAWDELTTMVFPDHERYGERRRTKNASFLDVSRFSDFVAQPLLNAFADHTGPIILEIAPMRPAPAAREFEDQLARFLARAPRPLHYAVELRNRELFTPRYLAILAHYAASHVLNYWTGMPTLREQMEMRASLPGPVTVVRLMLPPYTAYQKRMIELAPFDRILDAQPEMHEHVQRLITRTAELGHVTYVLASNKAEGCAPLTVRGIAERWAADHSAY
jgi:uncharacterized protein YecE (DUF72 family)